MLSINQKAEELYEKRIAPYAKRISESQKRSLIEFQKLIFEIDEYGESIKYIDKVHLDTLWNKAEIFLDTLKIDKTTRDNLLQDIKEYADMEAATRTGKKLLEYDIKFFYFKKSCDVRLQRHLIRYINNEAPVSSEEEITKDILEEMEDDLDDIEEDKQTLFSGNRFLEALSSQDMDMVGEYVAFVKSLENAHQTLAARILQKIGQHIDIGPLA